MNGNTVSLWLLGAKRTMTAAQLTAHIDAQYEMDVDGRSFWSAVRALHAKASR